MIRIVLFGSGPRAEAVANAVMWMSSPNGPFGPSDLTAIELLRIGPGKNVNDPLFLSSIGKPDLFIVAGFPQIFKKPLLDIPTYGTWNCHAGPVPEYRGGSPLNWQIIDGMDTLGISLLLMDEGIDTGPVIDRREFDLPSEEGIAYAHQEANRLFAEMVKNALDRFMACRHDGTPFPVEPQPDSKSYRKQRSDADGEIDMSWDGGRIVNFVRALTHPYPGAWVKTNDGRKLRIWKASLD